MYGICLILFIIERKSCIAIIKTGCFTFVAACERGRLNYCYFIMLIFVEILRVFFLVKNIENFALQ